MIIIGVDFHPEFQQIALVDTDSGELQEKRLSHRQEAESFYRALAGQKVRAGRANLLRRPSPSQRKISKQPLRSEPRIDFAPASEISHGYCGRARFASPLTRPGCHRLSRRKRAALLYKMSRFCPEDSAGSF